MDTFFPLVEPRGGFVGFSPAKMIFSEMVKVMEFPPSKPRTNFRERFRLCLPYLLQRGENFGHPGRSLLLNRYYQPLGVRHRIYEYSDYPDAWWIETALLDEIFPRRVFDADGRERRNSPSPIPMEWTYDDRGWVYNDCWRFESKSSTDYKKYRKSVINLIELAIGDHPFVVGVPDFFGLKEHEFVSWQYLRRKAS